MPRSFGTLFSLVRPAAKPIAWLVRDLAPYLVQGAVGWVLDRAQRLPGDATLRRPCRDCPFSAGGSTAAVEPTVVPPPTSKPVGFFTPVTASVVVVLTLALGGCGASTAYLVADQATYDAVAPEYRDYVTADTSLAPAEQSRRLRTLDAWQLRLDRSASAAITP